MAELRELLANTGFDHVKTYIQSGNVVLKSSETKTSKIEKTIKDAIHTKFGFDVSVIVKTREQLLTIFDNSPFPQNIKEKSYFAILNCIPDAELVQVASEKVYDGEDYYIINDCIYFYCEQGYGKAKFSLNFFERKLKVNATARNYRTMAKLLEMTTL